MDNLLNKIYYVHIEYDDYYFQNKSYNSFIRTKNLESITKQHRVYIMTTDFQSENFLPIIKVCGLEKDVEKYIELTFVDNYELVEEYKASIKKMIKEKRQHQTIKERRNDYGIKL